LFVNYENPTKICLIYFYFINPFYADIIEIKSTFPGLDPALPAFELAGANGRLDKGNVTAQTS